MIYVQLDPEGPIILMDEAALIKTEGEIDDEVEHTTWVEYRMRSDPNGRAIHRSVHVTLKKPAVFADGAVGGVG